MTLYESIFQMYNCGERRAAAPVKRRNLHTARLYVCAVIYACIAYYYYYYYGVI
jgi:hypothetical protein